MSGGDTREAGRAGRLDVAALFEGLQGLTFALAAGATRDDVARVAVGRGLELLGADRGALYVAEGNGSVVSAYAMRARTGEGERWRRVAVDERTPLGRAMLTGEPQLHADGDALARDYPHLAGLRDIAGPGAWATLPLVARGRVIGALGALYAEPRDFDEDDHALHESVTVRVALALDRATLFDLAERELRQSAFVVDLLVEVEGSRTFEGRCERLARALVPALGSAVSVERFDPLGRPRSVALHGRTPELTAALTDLRVLADDLVADRVHRGAAEAAGSGRWPGVVEGFDEALRRAPEVASLVAAAGLTTIDAVPLAASGEIFGALIVLGDGEVPELRPGDRFAAHVARQVSSALETAQLYDRQREIARALQRSLLPQRLPEPAGVELAACYHAAGEGMDVGGDFYDAHVLADGRLVLAIGDVCGKGADAARVTSLCRHTLRTATLVEPSASPARTLAVLHEALADADEGELPLVTAIVVHATPEEDGGLALACAAAGHPPPMRAPAGAEPVVLPVAGPMLGLPGSVAWTDQRARLAPGEALVLVTDGVTEARRDGVLLGLDGLARAIGAHGGAPLQELCETIVDAAVAHAGGALCDDVAVLAVRSRR